MKFLIEKYRICTFENSAIREGGRFENTKSKKSGNRGSECSEIQKY